MSSNNSSSYSFELIPISCVGGVWHALLRSIVIVAIELVLLDNQNRVLMIYRDDAEFTGWHVPGTVINEGDTVPSALLRLFQKEVEPVIDAAIISVKPIGWLHITRGHDSEEVATRNGVMLPHVARLVGGVATSETVGLFSLDTLPDDTLGSHKRLLRLVKRYLETGEHIGE